MLGQMSAGGCTLKVKKRGYFPLGEGHIILRQQFARKIEAVSLVDEGKVKRVRGWVTSAKVSPQLTTRVVDKVREVFNDYIPDVWIHTDHYKKDLCGPQPAFAISLQAETTTGVIYTKDFMFGEQFKMPEDLGERCAYAMLDEIFTGGAIDSNNQSTLLMLAALASSDNISSIKLARITEQSIQVLRHLKSFFNIQYRIKECEDDVFQDDSDNDDEGSAEDESMEDADVQKFPKGFIFSCIGIGLTNFARKAD